MLLIGFLYRHSIFSSCSSTLCVSCKGVCKWPPGYQSRTKARRPRRWFCCQSPRDPARPRFRIKEEDNLQEPSPQDEIESINSQLKREIVETRRRLGIEEKLVQTRKETLEAQNVEEVSLGNTLVASIIASSLAVFLDAFAWKVYSYVGTHPTSQTDMYIIQRLSGVIRLVLVGFSTLAGGIVSIVALGLVLLFVQTSIKRLMALLFP